MLTRVLEPEVMDTKAEAEDYDAMDHVEVNERFCQDFLAFSPDTSRVLDVGAGTARIPITLCSRVEGAHVTAVDLADHMLRVAKINIENARLAARITLVKEDAKALTFPDATFTAVVSNTILHHIPDPGPAFREMVRVLKKGGVLFLRDLLRPETDGALEALVEMHGGAPPNPSPEAVEAHARQVDLFRASLHASFTAEEVRALVAPLGIDPTSVAQTSDRHWTLSWKKSA
jgi:ubiquinone/menaquinone biosynthesis C-methylase UbiE